MSRKQTIIGLLIFVIVTMVLFLTLNFLFKVTDITSAIIGILVGLLAEVIYQKKIHKPKR